MGWRGRRGPAAAQRCAASRTESLRHSPYDHVQETANAGSTNQEEREDNDVVDALDGFLDRHIRLQHGQGLHPAPTAELTLGRFEVQVIWDELQRLRQSADRLRKQNRKVRAKVVRLKGSDALDDIEDLDEA